MSVHDLVRLQRFTESDLPDLDEVVLGTIEFLKTTPISKLNPRTHRRPLVVGSGNAFQIGRLMFRNTDAVCAEESTYEEVWKAHADIDALYIISASGSKHAVRIAEQAKTRGVPVYLITNTPDSPASAYITKEHVHVYPRLREPYTYNTSTYLAMLLGVSGESGKSMESYLETAILKNVPLTLSQYHAFLIIVPSEYEGVRGMCETKFDELFGPLVYSRAFTHEELLHAKTVTTSDRECAFVFGEPLPRKLIQTQFVFQAPPNYAPAACIAALYYLIGQIQKAKPPYFKEHISTYVETASEIFKESIHVIVE